ncbi:IST1 homolog [Ursus maritimus]|uniref:IST1 homolog n=2 Tax=Ursus TaxID=9639 RepID=A0A8M1G1H8_URSMA|nr:IST1 homolog [Ursus maritimus]
MPCKSKATIMSDSYKKNDWLPSLVPSPGLNHPTSPKPESRSKVGFDNFMLPDFPNVKPQANLSIDPYGSEDVDFEDPIGRLEMLKKTHNSLVFDWAINCPGIRALLHKF